MAHEAPGTTHCKTILNRGVVDAFLCHTCTISETNLWICSLTHKSNPIAPKPTCNHNDWGLQPHQSAIYQLTNYLNSFRFNKQIQRRKLWGALKKLRKKQLSGSYVIFCLIFFIFFFYNLFTSSSSFACYFLPKTFGFEGLDLKEFPPETFVLDAPGVCPRSHEVYGSLTCRVQTNLILLYQLLCVQWHVRLVRL